jgi:hypothetical protein
MEKVLSLLDGKKAIIGTVLMAINTYLITSGVIDGSLGNLLATIVAILTGVGVASTNQILGRSVRTK